MREEINTDTALEDRLESILKDYRPYLEELYISSGRSLETLASWLRNDGVDTQDLLEECHWRAIGNVRLYKCTTCGYEQYADADENIYCEECDDADLEEL